MNDAVCADTAAIARVFRALASPTRIRLLDWLTEGPHSVGELVAASRQKQANVSKHLGILHSANLVRVTRQGNRMIYSIDHPWVGSLFELVQARDTQRA
jgi:DNA-binding transcriptional ArsR family regulator